MTGNYKVNSLAMKGLDITDVSEYGFLLAADIRRRIRALGMLQVMGCKELNLLYKL